MRTTIIAFHRLFKEESTAKSEKAFMKTIMKELKEIMDCVIS